MALHKVVLAVPYGRPPPTKISDPARFGELVCSGSASACPANGQDFSTGICLKNWLLPCPTSAKPGCFCEIKYVIAIIIIERTQEVIDIIEF